MNTAIIEAVSRTVKTMADGTLRLTLSKRSTALTANANVTGLAPAQEEQE